MIQWGDTGRVVYSPLKTFNISLATPYENTLTTPQTLGTTTPTGAAAGDISYTIQQSDLPVISPNPLSVQYCAYLITSGLNATGSTVNLSFNVLKNGTSVITNQAQNNIANNNYWTHSHFRFPNVKVGDTIEAQTWSNIAGVTLNYYAVIIYPTSMQLTTATIVKELTYTMNGNPTLAKSTSHAATTASLLVYPSTNTSANIGASSGSLLFHAACINSSAVGYSGRLQNGDAGTGTNTSTNTGYWPNYSQNAYPSQISFREILR